MQSVRFAPVLLVMLVIAGLLAGCSTAAPQPKVYRVGVLSGLEYAAAVTDGFKEGMNKLGYVEGQNISYDVQKTNVDLEAYQRILKQFVADDVDLIVAFPTEAALDAKTITTGTNIPVVFSFAQLEGLNLVNSVREPGANITGVRLPGPEVFVKRFEVMHTILPNAKRILVPYLKDYPIVAPQLEAARPVAKAAGVTLVELPVASPPELEQALQAQVVDGKVQFDAILQMIDPVGVTPAFVDVMGTFAKTNNLPMGGAYIKTDSYETLFGIHVDAKAMGVDAAPLADKIFKNTAAGTIPVVSGDSIFQVSYREAQRLGLNIPEGILSEADIVLK